MLSVSANAAEMPKVLGEYGDWTAWTYNDRGNLICDIYTIITHRPSEKTFDEVSFVAGYSFDTKAPFTIKIGDKTFKNTFTEGTKGWMVSSQEDRNLIAAMKRGERMIVDGKSSRGTTTKDTYSLKGFSSAYQAISAKCKKK